MPPIPNATVSRLVTYLRVLDQLQKEGATETSSRLLAERAGVSPYQVRKDLTRFGSFGRRGSGYDVNNLEGQLRGILGLSRPWDTVIGGLGRLGQALVDYPNFGQYQFTLKALVDIDPAKVGTRIGDLSVHHPRDLRRLQRELTLDIGLITVPVAAAQQAADQLVAAGIPGILNFAPTVITVPEGVHVEQVDFLGGLKKLAFHIQSPRSGEPDSRVARAPSPGADTSIADYSPAKDN